MGKQHHSWHLFRPLWRKEKKQKGALAGLLTVEVVMSTREFLTVTAM